MYSGHGDSNYSFELLAGPVPIAGLECSSIKAGRAPILDRGLTAIPSLERGSSSCWGKRKLAQKQEQVGLPCPAGRWINEPSARAWELGLLEKNQRIAPAWEQGLLGYDIKAGRAPMPSRLVEIETNRRCVGAPAAVNAETIAGGAPITPPERG